MYVCMHACMYICMYVCMYVGTRSRLARGARRRRRLATDCTTAGSRVSVCIFVPVKQVNRVPGPQQVRAEGYEVQELLHVDLHHIYDATSRRACRITVLSLLVLLEQKYTY